MIPDIFLNIDDYENSVFIKNIVNNDNDLVVNVTYKSSGYEDDNTSIKNWRIDIKHCRKYRISFKEIVDVDMKEEHPLLWEFNDRQCELYFSGICENIPKLFYKLYLLHRALFEWDKQFDITTIENMRTYSNGLFAKGPKILLEKYAGCLKNNGMDYSFIGERNAVYWDGKQYLPEKKLSLLFLGESYFVAEKFSFLELNESGNEQ